MRQRRIASCSRYYWNTRRRMNNFTKIITKIYCKCCCIPQSMNCFIVKWNDRRLLKHCGQVGFYCKGNSECVSCNKSSPFCKSAVFLPSVHVQLSVHSQHVLMSGLTSVRMGGELHHSIILGCPMKAAEDVKPRRLGEDWVRQQRHSVVSTRTLVHFNTHHRDFVLL